MDLFRILALPVLALGLVFAACGGDDDNDVAATPGTPAATDGGDATPADGTAAPTVTEVKDVLVAGGAPSEAYAECVAERVVARLAAGDLQASDLRAWVDGAAPAGPAQDAVFAIEASGECTP